MALATAIDTEIAPGYKGLVEFCELIDEPLGPWQRRIARACFGDAREIVAILPKGNFKTTTAALIGLHHLLTVPGAEVAVGAASRRQAEIALRRIKGFAKHPAIEDRIRILYFEVRDEEHDSTLEVVTSEGHRLHGFSPTLAIGDEVWAWKERTELLDAMESALLKRPDAKLLLISTAAARLDSPLGRLRTRALAQRDVRRRGAVIEATGDLHWLEWSLPDEADLDDIRKVKSVNPAPYITPKVLRLQRAALPEGAFAQFHCNRWGASEGTWLPAGAWQACAGEAEIADGETVWAGVDIGGTRAASAVVIVTEDLRVGVRTWQGDDAVLAVADYVAELADRYSIREVAFDPWRFKSEALRLQESGLPMVEFAQSHARMVPASEGLHAAIVEQRLTHPNDPDLNAHVAQAIARQTPRGWRLDKTAESAQIDAVVALAMAVERAETPVKPARLLGWI